MMLKLIRCRVPPKQRDRFARGQRRWSALARLEGFLGQTGGWDQRPGKPNDAVILGFWRTTPSYDQFMREHHDPLYDASGQRGTYEWSHVSKWERRLAMPGASKDISQAVADAGFIRLAHGRVKPARGKHFMDVQERIWNPGMAAARVLAGVFCRRVDAHDEFLVCTLWRSQQDHQAYKQKHFPALREQADVDRDCVSVGGVLVCVDPAWRVAV